MHSPHVTRQSVLKGQRLAKDGSEWQEIQRELQGLFGAGPKQRRVKCNGPALAGPLQRRRADSNRRMEVLQTSALPLGYGARDGKTHTSPPRSQDVSGYPL